MFFSLGLVLLYDFIKFHGNLTEMAKDLLFYLFKKAVLFSVNKMNTFTI